jgi:hypothetical protein
VKPPEPSGTGVGWALRSAVLGAVSYVVLPLLLKRATQNAPLSELTELNENRRKVLVPSPFCDATFTTCVPLEVYEITAL